MTDPQVLSDAEVKAIVDPWAECSAANCQHCARHEHTARAVERAVLAKVNPICAECDRPSLCAVIRPGTQPCRSVTEADARARERAAWDACADWCSHTRPADGRKSAYTALEREHRYPAVDAPEPARSPSYPMGEFDAKKWAEEFVRIVSQNPSIATDEGTMLGWFASAIMTGHDEAKRRAAPEPKTATPPNLSEAKPIAVLNIAWEGAGNRERLEAAGYVVVVAGTKDAVTVASLLREEPG